MSAVSEAQVVILCGGYGTRIRDYPETVAKPMVPVGNRPILWHIMKSYSHYGFNDFIICLGFRAQSIRNYFLNFAVLNNDITLNLSGTHSEILNNYGRDEMKWKVTLVDTGLDTLTGGRVKRIAPYIKSDTIFISYGDTLSDINYQEQLAFHRSRKAEVTVTGVNQLSRFGHIQFNLEGKVGSFVEKPQLSDVVSGGFFVAQKKFVDRIQGDRTQLESEPLQGAARDGGMYCYHHKGFWTCMDTFREYELLNGMYNEGNAPWVKWKE